MEWRRVHCELCKKINFHLSCKWYYHKPESVLENEAYKILCDYQIHMDLKNLGHKIKKLVLIDKKKQKNKNKNEPVISWKLLSQQITEWKGKAENPYKYIDLAGGMKNMRNMKWRKIPLVVCAFGTVPKILKKRVVVLEIREITETKIC